MSRAPKVSIVTITYNQERYIAQALESFVGQKTDFPIEIIVADDHSTDTTPAIIQDFAKRYPDLVRFIARKKNVGALNNFYDALQKTQGQYIALCEGDDYWTDSNKLQRQADWLDKHSDYALCFHPVRVRYENKKQADEIFPKPGDRSRYTVDTLLQENFIQTNTVMYRRQQYANLPKGILPGDWYMHLYHAKHGKIGFIDAVMATYRRHEEGMWWDEDKDRHSLWQKHGIEHLSVYQALLDLYGTNPRHRETIYTGALAMLANLLETDINYPSNIASEALHKLPKLCTLLIGWQRQHLEILENQQQQIASLEQSVAQETTKLQQKQEELRLIKASRVWKARNLIAKPLKKPNI